MEVTDEDSAGRISTEGINVHKQEKNKEQKIIHKLQKVQEKMTRDQQIRGATDDSGAADDMRATDDSLVCESHLLLNKPSI